MKNIRFGVVYCAPPFFISNLNQMGYVEASELNISSKLSKIIDDWNTNFQKTFNEDYPPDSGFLDTELINRHNAQGMEISRALALELNGEATIEFVPLKLS